MVFYKILLKQREKITGSMALVYSSLVSHSLLKNGEVFDFDGNFDYELAHMFIDDMTQGGKYYLDYSPLPIPFLAERTGMTKMNVRLTIDRLMDENYIIGEGIYCPITLLDDGFIKIPNDTRLKGWQLIDYALMKERSIGYHDTIDTFANILAESLHTTRANIYKTIERLKQKGYAERLPDGKLLIK